MTVRPLDRLDIWLESRLENVAPAAVAVLQACLRHGYDHAEAYQLQLAVVEAVNNAIVHAYEGRAGNAVEITVMAQGTDLLLQISDQGKAMADHRPRQLDFQASKPETLPEGGMGLYIIHRIADRVEYLSDSGRNCLRLFKKLPGR